MSKKCALGFIYPNLIIIVMNIIIEHYHNYLSIWPEIQIFDLQHNHDQVDVQYMDMLHRHD